MALNDPDEIEPGAPVPGGPASPESLRRKIRFDNLFRFAVSITISAITVYLWSFKVLPDVRSLAIVLAAYTGPYLLAWVFCDRIRVLRPVDYLLSALDICAISCCIHFTGGPQGPLFYLYAIPFLVQAFHFDVEQIKWIAVLSTLGSLVLFIVHRNPLTPADIASLAGHWLFLAMVIMTAMVTVRILRKKDRTLQKTMQAMESNVTFLNDLNGAALELPLPQLQRQVAARLNQILKPLGAYARLWVYDDGWRTLKAHGEHPALRPGSPHYLPVRACPAFALRRPFAYDQAKGNPCPTEQFNYTSHLCLPVQSEKDTFGVLFLGTYARAPWDEEDVHFFETLAHSVAMTLQRKALFERLQEKITELNFSFEVGVAALASFVGSTQSIDETTVHILDSVLSILKVDRASLMLWNSQTQRLQTQWVRGTDFKIHSALTLGMGEGMAGWALQLGEPYWAEYAMTDPHYHRSAQPIHSLLCVPVFTVDRRPLGVINALSVHQPRAFSEREISFLKSFGQQAALAIENAQLHHKNRANIEQLKELDKMKSQFLSLVSHDLRGPLTGMRGYCEILKENQSSVLTPAQLTLVDQLERQVDLQERMVDDLLDFARMEKGRLSIHPVLCNLAAVLKEEVAKCQVEARERQIALSLSVMNADALPLVSVDEDRIRQVAWNLIHNALKFTSEEGRVVVRMIPDKETVTIEVSDTGVGLSSETQDRIFDKFFQITPGGSKGSQGLGLGLAICKEIVLAHRGNIRARSPGLGQGTTMTITLPIHAAGSLAAPLAAVPAGSAENVQGRLAA